MSIDMSPASIKGVTAFLPNAEIIYDKFHVIAHASLAVDQTRRLEQRQDAELKGLRRVRLRDRAKLDLAQRADLDALITKLTTKRTARAWPDREPLRAMLDRKQVHVVSRMLRQWCTNGMRFKVEPMKDVAQLIRNHLDGIVAWTRSRRPTASWKPSTGCSGWPNARHEGAGDLTRFARLSFYSSAGSTSLRSIPMWGYPHEIQKSQL